MRPLLLILLASTLAAWGSVAHGWAFSSPAPDRFAATVDRKVSHSGRASGSLRSLGAVEPRKYAVLMQAVKADAWTRRRIRMTGWLRVSDVSGWAGMWMRVDGASGPPLAFENMQNRPLRGSTGWTRCVIELPVAQDAVAVHFGALLCGPGQVWLDDVSFEALGPALPGAAERGHARGDLDLPVNLGFED
jgi:hypothetical protein